MKKICKKCLLRELANEESKRIEIYKEAIKKQDKVSDAVYEHRLLVCKNCDYLNQGTCAACGCYVELRAAAKTGKCPYHNW